MKNFIQPDKAKLKTVPVSEFADFIKNDYQGAKTEYLAVNIEKKIRDSYDKTIFKNNIMPSKHLMADLFDVSIGTMQNVYRILEDKGILYSKQCIGTLIADIDNPNIMIRKSSSKRDYTINLIKEFILKNKFEPQSILPSSRTIAKYINIPVNTTRSAMEYLTIEGILKKSDDKGKSWILLNTDFKEEYKKNTSLVNMISNDLKKYIKENLKIGDKMPTHSVLSKEFKVSIRTIHNSFEMLIKEGILLSKRGRYGTFVLKMPDKTGLQPQIESAIFAKSQITAKYHYERIKDMIKQIIIEKYSLHSKLPSILDMANLLDVSPNTIRKAYFTLSQEGYLTFERGRYGGTFVKEMPKQISDSAFEWVSISSNYVL